MIEEKLVLFVDILLRGLASKFIQKPMENLYSVKHPQLLFTHPHETDKSWYPTNNTESIVIHITISYKINPLELFFVENIVGKKI